MAAVASIKFTQGPNTDIAGRAVEGTLMDGAVVVTNGDNTDVASWEMSLLYKPPGSALTLGVFASAVSSTPSGSFGVPDVPGCYRVQEIVRDVYGVANVDIRNFGIRNARGVIVPPYQKNPDPIEIPLKDDELNFGGQAFGWLGDRVSGLHEYFFNTYDDLIPKVVDSTPFTAAAFGEEPFYIVDLAAIGGNAVFNMPASGWRDGQLFRIRVIGSTAFSVTVNLPGGHTIDGASSITLIDSEGVVLVYIGGNEWVVVSDSLVLVRGPTTATDEALARFDGSTGKLLQDSPLATLANGYQLSLAHTNAFIVVGPTGSTATDGTWRLPDEFSIQAWVTGPANANVLSKNAADLLVLGDDTNISDLTLRTAGTLSLGAGGANRASLDDTVLDLTVRIVVNTHPVDSYTLTAVKTGAYNAVICDLVRVDPSGGGFAVTLPTAVGQAERGITVKNTTNSVNAVTFDTTGGQTIDGMASGVDSIAAAYATVTFISDGANWMRFPAA